MLTNIEGLENIYTGEVGSVKATFKNLSNVSKIQGVGAWDLKSCEDFAECFSGCSGLTTQPDVVNWHVVNGSDFNSMFRWCSNLTSITIN